MLEPYNGKLSCTVLRRESWGNPADLVGKAASNAIKGRLVPDDDQFTLAVALLSEESGLNISVRFQKDKEILTGGDLFVKKPGKRRELT